MRSQASWTSTGAHGTGACSGEGLCNQSLQQSLQASMLQPWGWPATPPAQPGPIAGYGGYGLWGGGLGASERPTVAVRVAWTPTPGESRDGAAAVLHAALERLGIGSSAQVRLSEPGEAWLVVPPHALGPLALKGSLGPGVSVESVPPLGGGAMAVSSSPAAAATAAGFPPAGLAGPAAAGPAGPAAAGEASPAAAEPAAPPVGLRVYVERSGGRRQRYVAQYTADSRPPPPPPRPGAAAASAAPLALAQQTGPQGGTEAAAAAASTGSQRSRRRRRRRGRSGAAEETDPLAAAASEQEAARPGLQAQPQRPALAADAADAAAAGLAAKKAKRAKENARRAQRRAEREERLAAQAARAAARRVAAAACQAVIAQLDGPAGAADAAPPPHQPSPAAPEAAAQPQPPQGAAPPAAAAAGEEEAGSHHRDEPRLDGRVPADPQASADGVGVAEPGGGAVEEEADAPASPAEAATPPRPAADVVPAPPAPPTDRTPGAPPDGDLAVAVTADSAAGSTAGGTPGAAQEPPQPAQQQQQRQQQTVDGGATGMSWLCSNRSLGSGGTDSNSSLPAPPSWVEGRQHGGPDSPADGGSGRQALHFPPLSDSDGELASDGEGDYMEVDSPPRQQQQRRQQRQQQQQQPGACACCGHIAGQPLPQPSAQALADFSRADWEAQQSQVHRVLGALTLEGRTYVTVSWQASHMWVGALPEAACRQFDEQQQQTGSGAPSLLAAWNQERQAFRGLQSLPPKARPPSRPATTRRAAPAAETEQQAQQAARPSMTEARRQLRSGAAAPAATA